MYFINENDLQKRLDFIPLVCSDIRGIVEGTDMVDTRIKRLAEERLLLLAIEIVTDVGSLVIDAFMLRDASSYEDIVEILAGEAIFDPAVAQALRELVQLRKPLVQDYVEWPRDQQHLQLAGLPNALESFATGVTTFVQREKF